MALQHACLLTASSHQVSTGLPCRDRSSRKPSSLAITPRHARQRCDTCPRRSAQQLVTRAIGFDLGTETGKGEILFTICMHGMRFRAVACTHSDGYILAFKTYRHRQARRQSDQSSFVPSVVSKRAKRQTWSGIFEAAFASAKGSGSGYT